MRCNSCQTDNHDASRFCGACGTALAAACPACREPTAAQASFCHRCGQALRAPGPAAGGVEERKHVTILFADLDSSTELISGLDPEQAMERLDPVLAIMTQAVRRYGGTVARVMGDGVMALFGAPLSQEDHAAHACMAAWAMLERAAAEPQAPGLRVGLHSGPVVVRRTGAGPGDLDVSGATVHLASRMERLARSGTARLTAATARAARGFVEVAPLDAVLVRGFDRPVETFELLAATDRSTWEARSTLNPLTRFAGRAVELAMLGAARARAERGEGQVVTVVADAGMGKSRLLQEFLATLPASATVLRAAALSSDTDTSFHLAAGLLRSWLGLGGAVGAAAADRSLEALLGACGERQEAPALRALLDLPAEDPGWEALPAAERRRRMAGALRGLVAARAREGLVVVLAEDLHWADAASLESLAAIGAAAARSRVLLLATARPERSGSGREEADWRALEGHSWSARITLPPLPPEEAEQMLRAMVGEAPELAPLCRQLVEQTAGTPLFLEEMARSLRESGVLAQAASAEAAGRPLEALHLPDTVQAVLASRIDRLRPTRRALLQTASVVGRDVPYHLLLRLAERVEDLQDELDGLRDAEFLFEVGRPDAPEYAFKHALTHAVTYASLLLRHRREQHGQVLRLLQQDQQGGVLVAPERMALHAVRGEIWDEAAQLSYQAGLRANARSAWHEASGFFDWALDALERLPATAATRRLGIDVRLALRVALAALGEFSRILQRLEEARALAVALDDQARLTPIDVSACTILTNLGRLDEAILWGRRGADVSHARSDPGGILTSGFALGQAHWFRGAFADALSVLGPAGGLARGALRHEDLGTTGTASVLALVCLSKTHAIMGDFAAAAAEQAQAQAIAASTRKPYDLSYAALAQGYLLLQQDEHRGAVAALTEALAHARENGIALLVPSVARYLGPALVEVGRAAEARALLESAIGIAESRSLVGLVAWCRLGWACALAREDAAAEPAAAAALSLAERHGYRPIEVQALRVLARLRRRGDRPHEAAALLRRADALAASLGMRPEQARIRRDLAPGDEVAPPGSLTRQESVP